MSNPVALLRTLALIEGASFLVLLFLAMPLKYIWGQPLAVRMVGMAHGVLFVIFCVSLLYTTIVAKWSFGRAALIFAAAFFPFGPWLIDRRMKDYEADYLRERQGSAPASASRGQIALDKPAPKV